MNEPNQSIWSYPHLNSFGSQLMNGLLINFTIGRHTLIQATLSSMPTYLLSLFLLPSTVANSLDKLIRDFLRKDLEVMVVYTMLIGIKHRYLNCWEVLELVVSKDETVLFWQNASGVLSIRKQLFGVSSLSLSIICCLSLINMAHMGLHGDYHLLYT